MNRSKKDVVVYHAKTVGIFLAVALAAATAGLLFDAVSGKSAGACEVVQKIYQLSPEGFEHYRLMVRCQVSPEATNLFTLSATPNQWDSFYVGSSVTVCGFPDKKLCSNTE